MNQSNTTIYGALAIIALVIICVTLLVWDGSIEGTLYMGVVVGPIVGGLIGYVAGTKGVQQGSAASSSPPPPDA